MKHFDHDNITLAICTSKWQPITVWTGGVRIDPPPGAQTDIDWEGQKILWGGGVQPPQLPRQIGPCSVLCIHLLKRANDFLYTYVGHIRRRTLHTGTTYRDRGHKSRHSLCRCVLRGQRTHTCRISAAVDSRCYQQRAAAPVAAAWLRRCFWPVECCQTSCWKKAKVVRMLNDRHNFLYNLELYNFASTF